MSAPRDFNADLAMSNQPDVVAGVVAAIRHYIPEVLNVIQAHKQNDMIGVDYWLEFAGGRMETVDVKVRQDDYSLRGDDRTACLELVANIGTGKAGWSVDPDKRTDWIIFYYIETGKSFGYHARQLRSAVNRFLPELEAKGKASVQKTGRYESKSLFVSHKELGKAIYLNSQNTTAHQ